jgi:hypothetical protein
MNKNHNLSEFFKFWAETMKEDDAQEMEAVSVIMACRHANVLIAVTANRDGTFDNEHIPLHMFLHRDNYEQKPPYAFFTYEECPEYAAGQNLQQDQRSGTGEDHPQGHRTGHQPRRRFPS